MLCRPCSYFIELTRLIFFNHKAQIKSRLSDFYVSGLFPIQLLN